MNCFLASPCCALKSLSVLPSQCFFVNKFIRLLPVEVLDFLIDGFSWVGVVDSRAEIVYGSTIVGIEAELNLILEREL